MALQFYIFWQILMRFSSFSVFPCLPSTVLSQLCWEPFKLIMYYCQEKKLNTTLANLNIRVHKTKHNHILNIKGTKWLDQICMRVVSLDRPRKGRQQLQVFLNLFFLKSSKFLAAKYKNASNFLTLPKCCTILVWIAGCLNSSNILLTSSISIINGVRKISNKSDNLDKKCQ